MEKQIKAKSYTINEEKGNWLGQIVLTSDGMFSAVTDYGNVANAWRQFGQDFRKFICSLDQDYFATKIYTGMSYISHGDKTLKSCNKFAEKILSNLKIVIQDDISRNPEF